MVPDNRKLTVRAIFFFISLSDYTSPGYPIRFSLPFLYTLYKVLGNNAVFGLVSDFTGSSGCPGDRSYTPKRHLYKG